jgi:hypothetical protein
VKGRVRPEPEALEDAEPLPATLLGADWESVGEVAVVAVADVDEELEELEELLDPLLWWPWPLSGSTY